jgi:thymidylate kinase
VRGEPLRPAGSAAACPEFLSSFFSRLKAKGLPLCVLHGHERLPYEITSDIDCLVRPADWPRVLRELHAHCRESGWRIANAIRYEATSVCLCLAGGWTGGGLECLALDVSTDYREGAVIYRPGEIMAEAAEAGGVLALRPAMEFGYYLAKKVLKGRLDDEHGARLTALYRRDPRGAEREIARFWSGEAARMLAGAARTGQWSEAQSRLSELRRAFLRRRWMGAPGEALAYLAGEVLRLAGRWAAPTGFWVAVLGPDGSGKSTVLREMEKNLAPLFRRSARMHFRPGVVGKPRAGAEAAVNPHGRAPYGMFLSVAKVGHLAADYLLGYVLRLRPHLARSGLLLSDRCYHDLLVDPRRYRYGGPLGLARAVGSVLPKPDLFVFLDAPEDVLLARKRELPREELARQRRVYLALTGRMRPSVVVDASQPLEDVVRAACEAVVAALERRTLARLGLGGDA